MNSLQTNYQALVTDENEAPHESVIFHVASEGGKSRWNHVDDLDSFFRRVYTFHQKHGYLCIFTEELLLVTFYILILTGAVYCTNCIYFTFDTPPSPFANRTDNIHLSELFMSPATCAASLSVWSWLIIIMGTIFIVQRVYKFICTAYSYKEIEQFYDSAMKISKTDINNITWHEVQCRLREVQHEQQLCVHKSDLTELDIYHRILRHKNYMIAMVNKNILPLKYNVKFLGEWVYLSSGLEFNIELLLFGSLLSPFKGTGTLKEEYKKYSKRKEVAAELERNILIFGIINVIFAPVILTWQLLKYIVAYSGPVRNEPAFLSTRKWSSYSRLYLRHFNELDHELSSRLCRAYRPSKAYMKSFSSPLFVVISKFGSQIAGTVALFFVIWSLFTEKLLMVPLVIFIITGSTLVYYAFSSCVPDENAVFVPDNLMQAIIAEIHYAPDHFKEKAHTTAVRDEFSQLYQYTFVSIIEDLLSPVLTPLILIFKLRHRALDIVDFFRSFTVDVAGVGDVCSFALMDVSKHGNHHWMSQGHTRADQYQQAEDGKTELSLIHFTLMNPHWKPPPSSTVFIRDFKGEINVARNQEDGLRNAFYASLNSLSTMGSKYASLVNSIHHSIHHNVPESSIYGNIENDSGKVGISGGVSHAEGPPYFVQGGAFTSLPEENRQLHSLQGELNLNPLEIRAADMSLSALYMHEVHHRHMQSARSDGAQRMQSSQDPENNGNEESPLLDVRIQ